MTEKIKEQILAIRDTGKTNMFNVERVMEIAELLDFNELHTYLKEHTREYARFILTGECGK